MTQETISRAELDADQARQETTFTAQVYQLASELRADIHQIQADLRADMHQIQADLRADMHQMQADLRSEMHKMQADLRAEIHQLDRRMMGLERRMYFVIALATGLVIGAMQLS